MKGDTGQQGPKGDAGQSLTATPLAAGDSHCNGNGGVAISPANDAATVLGYVCNGADGAPGKDGKDGTNGAGLIGSACALPDNTAGTVQMSVAADGSISFTCKTAAQPPCTAPHATATCDGQGKIVSLVCDQGFADVNGVLTDGCEVDLNTDPANCGTPGNAIPPDGTNHANYACIAGTVVMSCIAPFADANGQVGDGCEVNLNDDPANCGTVGNAIPSDGTNHANYACIAGTVVMTCIAPFADANGQVSDGCEVNLSNDPANCGTVGNAIPSDGTNHASYACQAGTIVITGCIPPWADANHLVGDGCEVNLGNDPANCGSVGHVIPPDGTNHASYACQAGTVVIIGCISPWADANHLVGDGCEVNLSNDPANCGSVGHAIPPDGGLHAHWECANGQVVLLACVSGWFNANSSIVDGCEWQQDQYEPNDTLGAATNVGSFGLGGSVSIGANTTPGNPDWFTFTSTCNPFQFCTTSITVTGDPGFPPPTTLDFIALDTNQHFGNGFSDQISGVLASATRTYAVEVMSNTFGNYHIQYSNHS